MKKHAIRLIVFLVFAVSTSFASRKDEVTLLILPREDVVVRVGMDIAKRFPTLLLSYKVDAKGGISLHGWNGAEWVNVSVDNYRDGSFFKTAPESAVLIVKDGESLPEKLVPPADWCATSYAIKTVEIRPLIHLVGQYFDLKHKDWKWFSSNYDLPIEAINPEGLNIAWYHKRLNEHFTKTHPVGADDLQYWAVLRVPAPAVPERPAEPVKVEEPVEEEAEKAVEPEKLEPAKEPAEAAPAENPLEGSAPEAVVMGAGDAEEGKAKTEESKDAAESEAPANQE